MARKERANGYVQHDKGDDDIKGTIEVIATFVYARSPRRGPPSTQPIAAQLRCKVTPPDIAGRRCRQRTASERKARPRGPG